MLLLFREEVDFRRPEDRARYIEVGVVDDYVGRGRQGHGEPKPLRVELEKQ